MHQHWKRIAVIGAFACWIGAYAQHGAAQDPRAIAETFACRTTDQAREQLLIRGKSDETDRKYLRAHLPSLINSGPKIANCPGYPSRVWTNAIELAGRLKIGDTAPALARWISVKAINPWPGIHPYGDRLYIHPTAIALSEIGNPAIPALEHLLSAGNPGDRALAVGVLCGDNSAESKSALRSFLPRETDPDLRAMIKRCVAP